MAEFRGDNNITVRTKLGGGGLSIRNLPAALSGRREAPTLASPIDVEANEYDEEGGDDLANSPSCAFFLLRLAAAQPPEAHAHLPPSHTFSFLRRQGQRAPL